MGINHGKAWIQVFNFDLSKSQIFRLDNVTFRYIWLWMLISVLWFTNVYVLMLVNLQRIVLCVLNFDNTIAMLKYTLEVCLLFPTIILYNILVLFVVLMFFVLLWQHLVLSLMCYLRQSRCNFGLISSESLLESDRCVIYCKNVI